MNATKANVKRFCLLVTAKRKNIFSCVCFNTNSLTHVKCLLHVFLCSICIFIQFYHTCELIIIIIIEYNFTLGQSTKAQTWIYFLDLGARWWVVSTTPRPLYPRERPGTHCTGGWVGLRAGLEGCGKSRPYPNSIAGPCSP